MVIAVLSLSAWAESDVRYVFKLDSPKALKGVQPKRMNFGLSQSQMERLSALTKGEVNFASYYYIDRKASDHNVFSNERGFSGVIYPNVPPPKKDDPAATFQKIGDPELINQWWIDKLGVQAAWRMATGQGVTIADCDAGFYHDEPDLFANMLLQYRYDLSDKEEPLVVNDGPYATHGTSVTAIMAGVLNGKGTNGIAYNSKIVPLQNYNYDDSDDLDKEEATAACILKAVSTPDVDIIVLENQTANGSSETFAGTRDAVRVALKAGIIVVGAGGNYSAELLEEKKDDTGSIIVGALLETGEKASWSNFGDRVTVGAYGENLYTLEGPNGAFGYFGGTSGATPQVAATVALMKEVNPLLTPDQARKILTDTREITEANKLAGGKLDVPAAVLSAQQTPANLQATAAQWLFRQEVSAILANP